MDYVASTTLYKFICVKAPASLETCAERLRAVRTGLSTSMRHLARAQCTRSCVVLYNISARGGQRA